MITRSVIPLALLAGLAIFSSAETATGAAIETGYLALLSAAVLLPAAALFEKRSIEMALAAVLISGVVWSIPPGPTRGGAVTLLLVFTLGLAVFRRVRAPGSVLTWRATVSLALGVQLLVRSELLLQPTLDAVTLVRCFALPVLGAAALMVLARRHNEGDLLVGAAALVALGPGWTVVNTLALLALAAASLLAELSIPLGVRAGGVVAVILAASWRDPRLAVLLALGVAAYGARESRTGLAVVYLGALVTPLFFPPESGWLEALGNMAWLALLLPAALLPARTDLPRFLAALTLAVGGLCLLPPEQALAAPIALLVIDLPAGHSVRRLQYVWSAALLGTSVLLSTYPWLRDRPLEDAIALFGLSPGWMSALVVGLLVLGTGIVLDRGWVQERLGLPAGAAALAGTALLGIGAIAALPAALHPTLEGGVVELTESSGDWSTELVEPLPVSWIVLDSYLSASQDLPAGAPIGRVRLYGAGGAIAEWILHSGTDTGEWAARRPDVAARPGAFSPNPWLSWVAPGGFFGQRYRSRHRLPVPFVVERVEVTRDTALPTDVGLAIFHLGLSR